MKPKKLIYGVGINDADYVVKKWEEAGYINGKRKRKQVWMCPYYRVWADMLFCQTPRALSHLQKLHRLRCLVDV